MFAETNKERQARYRNRQIMLGQNERINAWVDKDALDVLEGLSKTHHLSQRKVLECLLKYFETDMFFQEKLAAVGKKPKQFKRYRCS